MTRKFDFDLLVIGGGSGGVRAARIAAGHGARVAVAEHHRFGGTCVIRGCVPKKLLVYAASFSEDFADAKGFGWDVEPRAFSWPRLIGAKDREIDRLEQLYRLGLENAGVAMLEGHADFIDPHTLKITAKSGETQQVSAGKILIACGAAPANDAKIAGSEFALSSNDVFQLSELPESIVIYGGGYIAVEFAGIMHGLGVPTRLIYRGEKILRGFDDDIRTALQNEMQNKGIEVICGDQISEIARSGKGFRIATRKGRDFDCGAAMFAIGRRPATAGLALEKAGVDTDRNGAVVVDGGARTNVSHIFAVGDVTNRVNLTPVAIREGHIFADQHFGSGAEDMDHDLIATGVFSQPEIGTVGLTEAEARSRFDALDIYLAQFTSMRLSLAGRDEKTLMKLVVNADDETVLGVHLLGPSSAEMIQLAAIALKMGATKRDFDRTIAVHPTGAEELVTMRSAARKIRKTG